MGWTVDLLTGLAEHLAANDVGLWQPDTPYDPAGTVPAIVLRSLPDAPGRAIALSAYGDADRENAGLNDVTQAVQIRSRGTTDPSDVEQIADAVWDLLHGAEMLTLGAVRTVKIYRRSTALLGTDTAGRWERTCNYYVMAARPNAHRPD